MSTWNRMPLVSVMCAGCFGGSEPAVVAVPDAPTVSDDRPHVILITLDTVRADRIGAFGYDKAKTETLDAMATMGRRYTRAYSPLPLTIPSHATMFTGLYPPTHGIRSNGSGQLGPEFVTLAERFKEAGYHTGASVAAFVTTKIWGFDQGFDAYFDDIPAAKDNFWHGERPGSEVVDDALGWAATVDDGQPIFLWVHLYDAHYPYLPSPEYLEASEGRPYDAEIAYVDDQVERIVEVFDGKPTLWVVVSDHGEGLGEHHELTHGMYVYDTTQHVPFFLYGAGVDKEVVDTPVSLADLAPTVLDHLGMELPEDVEGRVVPSPSSAPVYMESYQLTTRFGLAPHVAIVDGDYKLLNTPRPELYDIRADPRESTDLSSERPEQVERLVGALDAMGFAPPGQTSGAPMSPDVEAQLAALGYTDGVMPSETEGLPDPKDHVQMVIDIQRAERKHRLGDLETARATLQGLTERYPKVAEFYTRLAAMLRKMGRHDEAREVMAKAAEMAPSSPQLRIAEAIRMAEEGKHAEAAASFRALAEEVPFTPRIHAMAVMATRRATTLDEALALGESYRVSQADNVHLAGVMGVLYTEQESFDKAVPLLIQAVECDEPEPDVAYLLGARALGQGQADEAARLLHLELEHHPGNVKAAFALTRLHMKRGEWNEQIAVADQMLEFNPADAVMWHAKVLGLFNLERFADAREALNKGLEADPGHPDLLLMDANLLAKEGRRDEGAARFAEAQKAKQEREAAMERAILELEAQGMGLQVDPGAMEAAQGE